MKKYKPILAPNEEPELDKINYPILASYKLDGIRCIFYKGQMLSRSLKPIVNKQLREKFASLTEYSGKRNLIIDGEIYSPELTFQEITTYVMTKDFEDSRSVKKHGEVLTIPDHLKFYAFDIIKDDNPNEKFIYRLKNLEDIKICYKDIVEIVIHKFLLEQNQIEEYFNTALENGFEGLILRDAEGEYKFGRGTLKEGLIYKLKPFRTFDAMIIDIEQATKVDPSAEKKINELGRSVTSKKKGDRIPIEKASAFIVEYEDTEVKPVIALTDEEKEEIWKNKEDYIGRFIEYKGMLIGSKDKPRHPVFVRFRKDKDE